MAVIPRSIPEIVLDRIIVVLEAFRAAQVAEIDGGNAVDFRIRNAGPRDLPRGTKPVVNLIVSEDRTDDQKSTHTNWQQTFTVTAALIVPGWEKKDGTEMEADREAAKRLLYLVEQVRYALWSLRNYKLGLKTTDPTTAAMISQLKFPTVNYYDPDPDQRYTRVYVGALIEWEIDYTWVPEETITNDLEQIVITTGRSTVQIENGGS